MIHYLVQQGGKAMYHKPEAPLKILRIKAIVTEAFSLCQDQGYDISREKLKKIPRNTLEIAISRESALIIADYLNGKAQTTKITIKRRSSLKPSQQEPQPSKKSGWWINY